MNTLTINFKDKTNLFMSVPLGIIFVVVTETQSAAKFHDNVLMVSKLDALKIIDAQRNNENLTLNVLDEQMM